MCSIFARPLKRGAAERSFCRFPPRDTSRVQTLQSKSGTCVNLCNSCMCHLCEHVRESDTLGPQHLCKSGLCTLRAASNRRVQLPHLHWRSPESSYLSCKTKRLIKTICAGAGARLAGSAAPEQQGLSSRGSWVDGPGVCVCVCVRQRECVCVRERETERESVCESVKERERVCLGESL